MRVISAEKLKTLKIGAVVRVVWLCRSNKEYKGVIHGDKVNWDDGSHNEICEIVTAMQNSRCIVYYMGHSKINQTATLSSYR